MTAGSEQLVQVDGCYGLPPVAERAELWHEEGFVLLFAQQREHVLHQLAQPAVTVERRGRDSVGRQGDVDPQRRRAPALKRRSDVVRRGRVYNFGTLSPRVLTRTCSPWSVPGSARPWG